MRAWNEARCAAFAQSFDRLLDLVDAALPPAYCSDRPRRRRQGLPESRVRSGFEMYVTQQSIRRPPARRRDPSRLTDHPSWLYGRFSENRDSRVLACAGRRGAGFRRAILCRSAFATSPFPPRGSSSTSRRRRHRPKTPRTRRWPLSGRSANVVTGRRPRRRGHNSTGGGSPSASRRAPQLGTHAEQQHHYARLRRSTSVRGACRSVATMASSRSPRPHPSHGHDGVTLETCSCTHGLMAALAVDDAGRSINSRRPMGSPSPRLSTVETNFRELRDDAEVLAPVLRRIFTSSMPILCCAVCFHIYPPLTR